MPKRYTDNEFKEIIKRVHNDKIIVLGEYKNSKTKILVKNIVCNHEWEAIPHVLINGHGCPKCSKRYGKTTEEFKKEVFNLVGDEYEVLGEYKNNSTKIEFKHNECGNTFYMTPNAFLSGQRCPHEKNIRGANTNSLVLGKPELKNKQIEELCLKNNYTVIKGYKRANINLLLKCNVCGNLYSVKPYHFINDNSNCKCRNRSKGERIIEQYLKDNNYKYSIEYCFNDCKNQKKLFFDFAILDKDDKVLFLIEFDGTQHYQIKYTEEDYRKCVENDNIKNEYCINNNIPLIRIKYNRSIKYFKETIINELEEKISNLNMPIPSEALRETFRNV